MGAYLNPDNIPFQKGLNSQIYIDKSEMVLELERYYETEQQFICISRPRRFGKTVMMKLLSAYYSKGCDSRALFEKMKIAELPGWDVHLNSVNVIKIDVNGWYSRLDDKSQTVSAIKAAVVKEFKEEFPNIEFPERCAISDAMIEVNKRLGEKFVVLIDEYDVLFREEVDAKIRKEYLDLLNALFKDEATFQVISLAYLTGILPIVRDQVQSKLNNFTEFTMIDPGDFASYFGFTEDEVADLCAQHDVDFVRCRQMYDGYSFPGVEHVFNPKSVASAMASKNIKSYWAPTSSSEIITCYINENMDGIQEDIQALLEGNEIEVNVRGYDNHIDSFKGKNDVFTFLIHLGYLSYDQTTLTCRIPNAEIRAEWIRVMDTAKGFERVRDKIEASRNLIAATEKGDADTIASALDYAHRRISSHLTFNLESSLQSAILMAYFYADQDYMVFSELPAGEGFADVALIPLSRLHPAIIIELKREGDPQKALDQIKSRRYDSVLSRHPGRGIVLVGIAYDAKEDRHRCVVERVQDYKNIWK